MTISDPDRSDHAAESGSYNAFSNIRCYLPWIITLAAFGWGQPASHLRYYLAVFLLIVMMLSVPLNVCRPGKSRVVSRLRMCLLLITASLALNIIVLFDGDFCRLLSGVALYKYANLSNTAYLAMTNAGSPKATAVANIAFVESVAILLVPLAYYIFSGERGMLAGGLSATIFPSLGHVYKWWRYLFIFSAISDFIINLPPDYTGHSRGQYGPMGNFALNPLALVVYSFLLSFLSFLLLELDRVALLGAYNSRKDAK